MAPVSSVWVCVGVWVRVCVQCVGAGYACSDELGGGGAPVSLDGTSEWV